MIQKLNSTGSGVGLAVATTKPWPSRTSTTEIGKSVRVTGVIKTLEFWVIAVLATKALAVRGAMAAVPIYGSIGDD